jgi:undecaprenyl-diphosphatase
MIAHQAKSFRLSNRFLPAEIVVGTGLITSVAAVCLLLVFHGDIRHPTISWLDESLPNELHSDASGCLTMLMLGLTIVGSPPVVVSLMAILLVWMIFSKRYGDAIGLTLSEVGALLLNQVSKEAFHRARPDPVWAIVHEHSFSFPSGHAMLGIVSYGTIAYLLIRHTHSRASRRAIGVVFAMLIFGIGISRVYLGAHYPSDIIAGWLAGGVWLAAIIFAVDILHKIEPSLSAEQAKQPIGLEDD